MSVCVAMTALRLPLAPRMAIDARMSTRRPSRKVPGGTTTAWPGAHAATAAAKAPASSLTPSPLAPKSATLTPSGYLGMPPGTPGLHATERSGLGCQGCALQ